MRVAILDGYVDEPSCLGVPPYISPYSRYLAGAVVDAGHMFNYLTIDQLRSGKKLKGDMLIVLAGCLVPGRYLRGMPISNREIASIGDNFEGTKVLGGPLVKFGFHQKRTEKIFDHLAGGDLDACVFDYLCSGSFSDRERSDEEWARWSVKGAEISRHHPDFPQPLVAEIDVSRGCVRYFTGGCSFCIEPLFGRPYFRDIKDIAREVKELARYGVTNFRLGGQSCFFCYRAKGIGETEKPEPNPSCVRELLKGIRKAAPNLRVLHTDNADPAVVSAHPDKSKEVLMSIAEYCTSGNVLSFGMESADPDVIEKNNLNARPDEVLKAVEIVNSVGARTGPTGLPIVLPGINLISGLRGESKETFEYNFQFLKSVLDSGLLLRRINIRQVLQVRARFPVKKHYRDFRLFKKKVREEIDRPMLKRLLPKDTVLRDVYLELRKGRTTFGRQVGSYPILVGIPYGKGLNEFIDVAVLSHGFRSVAGIEYPLDVNEASLRALASIPGIGPKRAGRIVRARPILTKEDFIGCLDEEEVAVRALHYVRIG